MNEDINYYERALKVAEANSKKNPIDMENYGLWFDVVRELIAKSKTAGLAWDKKLRQRLNFAGRDDIRVAAKCADMLKKTYLVAAPFDFDSYCIYLEWNREPEKKFYIPRRKQLLPVVEGLQQLEDDELDLLAISEPPGIGKALANDTPILTSKGWKNHGDLVVGDQVVGMDGMFKKVIAVHPKCMLDVMMEFTNGEKIQCHENHEWMLIDKTDSEKAYLRETKEYEKHRLDTGTPGKRGHYYRWHLPHKEYVQGIYNSELFDPYTFGVWLGDGTNRKPRICEPRSDRAIVDKIERNGYKPRHIYIHATTNVWYYDYGFRPELRKMGFCNSRKTNEKYIPQEYLVASVEQRLELLAGLLDTDGTLCNGKKYQFSTTSEKLRDTFVQLVSTFGWRCCITAHEPCVSSSGVIGRHTCYNIGFTPDTLIPCALERKKNIHFTEQRSISLKSITRVEPKEGNCITVEGDGMYLAGHTMLPTHNTTLAIFYLTWLGGRNPELPSLGGSHSNSFLRGVYDDIGRVIDGNGGEYLWRDVFPGIPVVGTNAKDMRLDLGKAKRFETFEFSSIGSGNAGKVRAGKLLYCDDLIDGIETALSKERLDKVWQQYYTDLRQRKIGRCKELHIATRWSVHDVIGRLEVQYENDPRAKFLRFPALDENDESNFDYPYHLGFTTEFYHEQRAIMDTPSWNALYMNEPIEREGLLYPIDSLRRFYELPEDEPDGVIAVCDTAEGGGDDTCMVICAIYGEDHYCFDVVCSDALPEITDGLCANALLTDKVKMCQFESNSAGGRTADKVQDLVKAKGGHTNITKKRTTANKETKIIVNSAWVKDHMLFLDEKVIQHGSMYANFIKKLCSYTVSGKNKHDDCPDAVAQYAIFAENLNGNTITIANRTF